MNSWIYESGNISSCLDSKIIIAAFRMVDEAIE